MAVLESHLNGTNGLDMTQADVESFELELAQLRAENARLKARKQAKLTIKTSAKGAVSVYGLGRWPVTLYKTQWLALLADTQVQAIKDYIVDNDAELSQGKDD